MEARVRRFLRLALFAQMCRKCIHISGPSRARLIVLGGLNTKQAQNIGISFLVYCQGWANILAVLPVKNARGASAEVGGFGSKPILHEDYQFYSILMFFVNCKPHPPTNPPGEPRQFESRGCVSCHFAELQLPVSRACPVRDTGRHGAECLCKRAYLSYLSP